jgi:predicted extracellular nuclease
VDDPFDSCDFHTDEGCPGTRFPLNYVPPGDDIYRARLRRMADQIVREMKSPELLLIQEAEDQDIARMEDGKLVYGQENDADGSIDALQELALEIEKAGGPRYEVAVDRDATDGRGIICAWMYQAARFEKIRPAAAGTLLGPEPGLPEGWEWMPMVSDVSNPKAFNAVYNGPPDSDPDQVGVFSRSVQVLTLRDLETGEGLWILNNHFNAGPDRKVARRRQQAEINAMLYQHIVGRYPDALVIVGGDLNVFPRPDDPLDPPSDQLGPLYEAGLFNVFDRIVEQAPANAYSYIYRGVPNVLDHFFLSPAAQKRLGYAAYMKLNASAPEAFPDQAPLRASDHDPLMIVIGPPGE